MLSYFNTAIVFLGLITSVSIKLEVPPEFRVELACG
jgi:hypothetical protein